MLEGEGGVDGDGVVDGDYIFIFRILYWVGCIFGKLFRTSLNWDIEYSC